MTPACPDCTAADRGRRRRPGDAPTVGPQAAQLPEAAGRRSGRPRRVRSRPRRPGTTPVSWRGGRPARGRASSRWPTTSSATCAATSTCLIVDEVHEHMKARGSAQGLSAGILADACGKSLALSGHSHGRLRLAPSSTCSTGSRPRSARSSGARTSASGSSATASSNSVCAMTATTTRPRTAPSRAGAATASRRRSGLGMAPAALFHLIGHSLFLQARRRGFGSCRPTRSRSRWRAWTPTKASTVCRRPRPTASSRPTSSGRCSGRSSAVRPGCSRPTCRRCLAYPEGCTRGESVFDPDTGDLIVQLPPLDAERVYPKEQQLIDLVAAERLAGRRVLVYATHTGTRDITGRLETLLTRHGFRVAVMKADKVEPKRREAWVAKRVEEGDRRPHLPPAPGPDRARPDRSSQPCAWYETDYSGLHHAPGLAPQLADRSAPAGQGRVHGLPAHAAGRRAQAGRAEAAVLARGRGRLARGRARRLRRHRRRPDDGPGPQAGLGRDR